MGGGGSELAGGGETGEERGCGDRGLGDKVRMGPLVSDYRRDG